MSFLDDILESIGWSDKTYLPIGNEENKALEILLNARIKELEKLRLESSAQDGKQNELTHHKKNLQWEHQENMLLLAAYKEQMDNEEHLSKLASSEVSSFLKDIEVVDKQCKLIDERGERVQGDIGKVLRKLETLRGSVGGERGALDEWSTALQRREADIEAINKFSKEDNAHIAELERKRQRLKVEHDKKHELLSQLSKDLLAEERSAESVSDQIAHALAQRRNTVATWAGAVENVRQREKDIAYMKGELDAVREFAKRKAEYASERQDFLMTQKTNNLEAERDLSDVKAEMTRETQKLVNMQETTKAMESEIICARRELVNASNELSSTRGDNKRLCKEKQKKQDAIECLKEQISKYNEKLGEVMDGSKTAAHRIRQLEEMLKSEEKYIQQLKSKLERFQHCLFLANQRVFELKEEGDLSKISKGYKIAVTHFEAKELKLEKNLMKQQEILYTVEIRLQSGISRMDRLEGAVEEMMSDSEDALRVQRLICIARERAQAVATLANQLTKLATDSRVLARNLDAGRGEYEKLRAQLNKEESVAAGVIRMRRECLPQVRAKRAKECTLRLRIAQVRRALKHIEERGYNVEKSRLDLDAAAGERAAEVNERRKVFMTQRRILQDQRGSLQVTLKTEQQKVEQLKKRYEIYAAALGKDEMGEALSITYYKVKIAQERSELQLKGDTLDAQIRKGEQEIASLEATLRVMDCANRMFVKSLNPMKDDDPDMLELSSLSEAYDNARSVRSQITKQTRQCSKTVDSMRVDITNLEPRMEELQSNRDDLKDELLKLHKNMKDQQEKLNRAIALRKKSGISARKKIKDLEIWNIYERDIQTRLISEANRSAGSQLRALGSSIIDKRALLHGLNLSQVFSAPPHSKVAATSSDRNSGVSEQEILSQRSLTGSMTASEHSLAVAKSAAGSIGEQLRAVRKHRSPLSDSQGEDGSFRSDSIHASRHSVHSSLPVSVVTLGIDTAPDETSGRKYPKSGLPKKTPKGKGSTLSLTSKKSHSSTQ